MQSKMGYVLLMVAVMIGSRVCGVEATITCANTDGANLEYDCGMVDDLIDENPSSIECSDQQSQCTSDECCTVAPTPVDCVQSVQPAAADCTSQCGTERGTVTTEPTYNGVQCVEYDCQDGDGACAVVNCVESGNTAADCTADCTATYTETTAASGGGTACVGARTCESGDGDCFSCTMYATSDETDESSWSAAGVETCEEGVKFCVFSKMDDIGAIACDGVGEESSCDNAARKEGCTYTYNDVVLATKCFDSDQGVKTSAEYKSTMDDIVAGGKQCSGVGAHGLNAAVLMLALFGYSFSQ